MSHTYTGPEKISATMLYDSIPSKWLINADLREMLEDLERLKKTKSFKDGECRLELSLISEVKP